LRSWVAAEREIEPLVAPAVAGFGRLAGARERLGALRPRLDAAEDDVGQDVGVAAALGDRGPCLLGLGAAALAVRDQRRPRAARSRNWPAP